MARPSVTTERREEILAAFARCVARDGVEGASLQQVAEEAGLARALLRHHVGNREDLVLALATRFCHDSLTQMQELIASLPKTKRLERLTQALFNTRYASSTQDLQIAAALINAAASRPALKKMLRRWYGDFEKLIAEELTATYPQAEAAAVAEVATAIVALAFSADSLTPLGKVTDIFDRSHRAALRLARTLGA